MRTEGEAYPHNDTKQGTVGLRAEGSRQSLGFPTHLGNSQLILLEATERHRGSEADFSWMGRLQPSGRRGKSQERGKLQEGGRDGPSEVRAEKESGGERDGIAEGQRAKRE